MTFNLKSNLLFLLAAVSLLVACQEPAKKGPSGIEHVIVIGVDGLSPDGLKKAQTPVMDSLIASGAVKWTARTVITSASSQNWASMLMGTGPEIHGIINNDWEIDNHELPPVVHEKDGRFPTIFSLLRNQRPEAEIGVVYHWSGFGRLYQKDAVSFDRNLKSEDSTTAVFAEYVRENKPVLGFMHLDHVDGAGHRHGHGSEGYYQSISKTDSLVKQVVDAINAAGIAQKTLLMIVSDHGGFGRGHGGYTTNEMEVPVVFCGAGVRKGYEIVQQAAVYDIGPTIAFALGIDTPYEWTGRPLKAAFDGFSEPENNWGGARNIASPIINPAGEMYKKAGGIYVDQTASVSITPADPAHTTRYTLDGTEPDASSPVYNEPFQVEKTTVVKAKSFDAQGNVSPVSVAYFRIVPSDKSHGVKTTFYNLNAPEKLPVFEKLRGGQAWDEWEITPNEEKIMALLQPGNSSFGLVIEGFLEIDEPGRYRFYTHSDDGSKLYVKGEKIVDNDGPHAMRERSGAVTLTSGKHPIKVEYYNGEGSGWLEAYYQGPGVPKQLIPADKLYRTL